MSFREAFYVAAIRTLRGSAFLLARGEGKVARGIRGRRDAPRVLARWGREDRDQTRGVVWFHAPSVGEGLQARAVMHRLRETRPDLQLVYTYFSPSAEGWAGKQPVQVSHFLPWDLPGEVGPVLDAVEPDLLVFTKTEVWPVLAREADRRGVPSVMVAGTLPRRAGRLRWPARFFLRKGFGRLRRLGAVSEEDGVRFTRLGVPGHRITVTGDPGVDSAWERVRAADPEASHLRPFFRSSRPTLVAGSTWAPDEERLIPAVARARGVEPDLLLLIAPHEPTPDHLDHLERALTAAGVRSRRLSEVEERGTLDAEGAVVVDRVGILADLYRAGSFAYVGGGFHQDGLHSVLEPAAAGIPVAFGPNHTNARSAGELILRGGALEVRSEEDLVRVLERWLTEEDKREGMGTAAERYMEEHRGAARRNAELVSELLDDP